jgi:hypothetical protein
MRLSAVLLFLTCGLSWSAEQFSPDAVNILGDIEYGQSSSPVDCPDKPKYCALLFNGHSGDKVDVTVKSAKGKAFVALADGSLKELTRGDGHLVFTLHDPSPDLITYYIVFSDPDGKPAQFTVNLKKVAASQKAGADGAKNASDKH